MGWRCLCRMIHRRQPTCPDSPRMRSWRQESLRSTPIFPCVDRSGKPSVRTYTRRDRRHFIPDQPKPPQLSLPSANLLPYDGKGGKTHLSYLSAHIHPTNHALATTEQVVYPPHCLWLDSAAIPHFLAANLTCPSDSQLDRQNRIENYKYLFTRSDTNAALIFYRLVTVWHPSVLLSTFTLEAL